ncbi:MAG: TonB-dependent siderophore receptor [Cyanobacteria bacterium J06623_4]
MKPLIELIFLRAWHGWNGAIATLLFTPLLLLLPATTAAQIESNSDSLPAPSEQLNQQTPSESPLLEQLRAAQPAEITDIQLVQIDDGLQIILITDRPERVEVFQLQEGAILTVDITNAFLSLPEGVPFEQLNPVPGVASLNATQRGNEIQLTIVSENETPPVAYFERALDALQLDVVTLVPGANDASIDFNNNNLRIIVTAQPLGFRVPTASTGTRTNTDLLDVPQGIQIIPEAVIESQNADSLADTLRNVSGVTAGRSATGLQATTPVIRGFESDNILRNGLRDDTLRIGAGINNIEQIEILKGPASVLFGAGSLGGTINLVTEVPLNDPFYEVEFSGGSNSFYGASIDLTGPFNDEAGQLGYRLNMAYQNQSSFRDFERSELFFVAPSLQLANTDRSSLILDVEYLSRRGYRTATGLPAVPALGFEGNPSAQAALEQGLALGRITGEEEDIQRAGTLDIRTNPGEPDISYTETDIARIGYRYEYDFNDDWKIRNEFLGSFQETAQDSGVASTGYNQQTPGRAGQPNFGVIDRLYFDNPSSRDVYTLNTNIVGDYELLGIDQTLLLGAEFSREVFEDVVTQRLFFPLPGTEPFNIFEPNYDSTRFFNDDTIGGFSNVRPGTDSITRRQTLGFYGQLQLDLTDYFLVLLGGRFDIADQFFVDAVNRSDTSEINTYDTAFSPRVGVVLKPIEDISLYAGYTESFVPTIGRNFDGEIFIPEEGRQFEAGVKANLFSDRLSLTLAYYDLRRQNVVTQDPDPNNLGFQVQVGEQASSGVEFDLVGEILPGWNIIANYAYTDARISRDNRIEEGLSLPNAPTNSANLWTSYEIQSGDLRGLGLGLGVSFVDERNGSLNSPFTIPAYTRTDASLFYRRNGFNAQLNFENLFDVRYFEGARDEFRVLPGAPFSVVGSVKWEF